MIIRNLHRREEINQYRQRSIVFEVHNGFSLGSYFLVTIRQDKIYTTKLIVDNPSDLNTINSLNHIEDYNDEYIKFISESVDKIWEENSDWFD